MIPQASGKRVAVVGRAASLIGSGCGPQIDACELVVRVNWVLPLQSAPEDIGSRTDLIYSAVGGADIRTAADRAGVPYVIVRRRLRKRLRSGLRRPTTGVVAIYDLLKSGARAVHAFGFDCYRTLYAEGNERTMQRLPSALRWRHDDELDRALLRRLLPDPRFHPDRILRDALS